MLEHDVDRTWRLVVLLLQPDDDTAESRDRQIKRHAHAADAAADHDAFAVKIHNPPALIAASSAASKRTGREKGSSRDLRLDPVASLPASI